MPPEKKSSHGCGVSTIGPGSYTEAVTKHIYNVAVKRKDSAYGVAIFSSLQTLRPTLVTALETSCCDTLMCTSEETKRGERSDTVGQLKKAKKLLYREMEIHHWTGKF